MLRMLQHDGLTADEETVSSRYSELLNRYRCQDQVFVVSRAAHVPRFLWCEQAHGYSVFGGKTLSGTISLKNPSAGNSANVAFNNSE